MTMTQEDQALPATTTIDSTIQASVPAIAVGPDIKLHTELYRYCVAPTPKFPNKLKRFLGKKGWSKVDVIIYDDSTLKVFENEEFRNPVFEIKLENVALFLAFGKAANKYGPPSITNDEMNFVSVNNLIAIPESKERDKVQWFVAKDEYQLRDLMKIIAETIGAKVNPPQLGKGAKYRYTTEDPETKWKTYWTTHVQQASMENVIEENGEKNGHKFVATPLVAILEEKKKIEDEKSTTPKEESTKVVSTEIEEKKAGSPEVPPKSSGLKSKISWSFQSKSKSKPQIDYYNIKYDVPNEVSELRYTPETNLNEMVEEEKIISVKLVNGKPIKHIIVVPKPTTQPAAENTPEPPNYPPPAIPEPVADKSPKIHEDPKISNGERASNLEAINLVKEDPKLFETAQLKVEEAEKKDEIIEINTSQQSTVVNVANVEHTITSSTEYVANGISCTTTKETTTIQQLATNGATVVH